MPKRDLFVIRGNEITFLTYDKELITIDPECGITYIGYPIQREINLLDDKTLFIRLKGDKLTIGDDTTSYSYGNSQSIDWVEEP